MQDLIFLYGTLMSGLGCPTRTRLDQKLSRVGRGWINATLFNLRTYPAAVSARDGRVWGELNKMLDPPEVLRALDAYEGFTPRRVDTSLYLREEHPVTLELGGVVWAWMFVYNAPLGQAQRIAGGDYREYVRTRSKYGSACGSAQTSSPRDPHGRS